MKTSTFKLMSFILGILLGASVATCLAQDSAQNPVQSIAPIVAFRPAVALGGRTPSDAEIDGLNQLGGGAILTTVLERVNVLESFIAGHPDGAYSASVRSELGRLCRDVGYYSRALKHFEIAWELTRAKNEGPEKEIADYTLAHWMYLLSSLGRVDTLKKLSFETEGRVLDGGTLSQMYLTAIEAGIMMTHRPGISFRCGTFALENVAAIISGKRNPRFAMEASSSTNGFTLSELTEKGHELGLEMVAVRMKGNQVPVPSVVHWKENHYAAIVAKRGNQYRIIDPTFKLNEWVDAEVVLEEASGYFLMQRDKVDSTVEVLDQERARGIYGKGGPNLIDDSGDRQCLPPPGSCECSPPPRGGGPGAGGSAGGGCGSCGREGFAVGSPVWRVSEPFISLWLEDEPLGYQPTHGDRMAVFLTYKQRGYEAGNSGYYPHYEIDPHWQLRWLSYVEIGTDDTQNLVLYKDGGKVTHAAADNSTVEYHTSAKLERVPASGTLQGYIVHYGDGSSDEYLALFEQWYNRSAAYLSKRNDRHGRFVRFYYKNRTSVTDPVLLDRVEDVDGNDFAITYHSTFIKKISQITDPFSRNVQFTYSAAGILTNITDAASLQSRFAYDGNGWITNMVTPNGTTTFSYVGCDIHTFETPDPDIVNRAVDVTLPTGGHHLYLHRDWTTDPDVLPEASDHQGQYLGSDVPSLPGAFSSLSLELYWHHYRNSWYWGPKQYALLSGYPSSVDVDTLTGQDYRLGWQRHWLHGPGTSPETVFDTLSFEREPSTNGTARGQMTWYSYDGKSSPIGHGDTKQVGLVARVLPDGTTWFERTERDSFARPTSIISSYTTVDGTVGMRTNQFVYDSSHNLVKTLDASFATNSNNLFDTARLVVTNWNAMDEITRFFYTAFREVSGILYPGGLTLTNRFYTSGPDNNRLKETVLIEIGATNRYTYLNGQIRTITDPRELTITNFYDNLDRLIGQAFSDDGTTTSNVYTGLNITAKKDRLNKWTYFAYNGVQQLTAVTNAIGTVTAYGYCDCGSLTSLTNAFGVTGVQNVTTFENDIRGMRTNSVLPDLMVMNFVYDAVRRLIVQNDPLLSVTNTYSNQGLLLTRSNALGQVIKLVYDINDRVVSETDANGVVRTNIYDKLGRVVSTSLPAIIGTTESFGYTNNTLIAYTNGLSKRWLYGYDAAGRKTSETNANDEVTSFSYSSSGDLLTLTDGKGHTTSWNYDQSGSVTNKVQHGGTEILRFRYDAENRLTNRWSKEKLDTFYTYNWDNTLTNIDYTNSTDIVLRYDALGRLTNMVDAVGSTAYTYDAAGQMLTENGPWAQDTVTVSYTNRLRSAMSIAQPYSSPWQLSYGYDVMRRLTSIGSGAGSFSYLLAGTGPASSLPKRILFPNGAYITNTYDALARLSGTFLKNGSDQTLNSHAYLVNTGHQRYKQTFNDANYTDYTYDNAGQLKTAYGEEAGGADRFHERFAYSYDAGGNLTNRTQHLLSQTFKVNDLNQLSNVTRSGTSYITAGGVVTGDPDWVTVNGEDAGIYSDGTFSMIGFLLNDGINTFVAKAEDASGRRDTNTVTVNLPATVPFTYDQNGNVTSDGTRGFDFDDENQLIRVTVTNSWKSEFLYDGLLRRRVCKEFQWKNSAWVQSSETRYIFDGLLPVQERDGNNVPRVTYTRGIDLSGTREGAGGIGGLLARTDHSSLIPYHSFYHSDGSGNITALINANQLVVAKYHYDPFGNTLAKSGSLAEANTFRFSSKEIHASSGLYYYGFRFYEPNLQRWLNQDPLGEEFDENLYRFVYNDPNSYVDPDGEAGIVIPFPAWALPKSPDPVSCALVGGAVAGYLLCEAFPDAMTKPGEWIGNLICPIKTDMGRNNPPIGKPGRKGQGREINEGKRKHPSWQPRGPQRPLKPHTPGRGHRRKGK